MKGPPRMANERGFEDYLTRHMSHRGDPERHRTRKRRQLMATYARWLPANRDAELLEIGPGYGQWLEALRVDLGYTRTVAVDVSAEVVGFCNRLQPGSTTQVD